MPFQKRPNCYNSRTAPAGGYWAQDGWTMLDGVAGSTPNWVWISTEKMTTECQSDFPGCAGCKDFKGELNG